MSVLNTNGFSVTALSGTTIKFIPMISSYFMITKEGSTYISTRHQCISFMNEYENKSLEEWRWEDYILNGKAYKRNTSLTIGISTETYAKLMEARKFHEGLKEMLISGKHSDFTVIVKEEKFRVHKIILAVRSPVFAAMLEHDTKEKATGTVNIEDCEPLVFAKFLMFLYTGKVEDLNSDNVLDLYETADKYQVTELSKLCVKYMINNISIMNFCNTLTHGLRHHLKELIDVAIQFFLQNSKEIAKTTEWTLFLQENPVAGNELFLKVLNLKE